MGAMLRTLQCFLREWHLPWSPLSIMESHMTRRRIDVWLLHSRHGRRHSTRCIREKSGEQTRLALLRVISLCSLMESAFSWSRPLSSYGAHISHAIIMHIGGICYKPKEATIQHKDEQGVLHQEERHVDSTCSTQHTLPSNNVLPHGTMRHDGRPCRGVHGE